MEKKLTIKNNSKSRRGFLKDLTKWIGGAAALGAAANVFTSNKVNADTNTAEEPYLSEIMLVGFNFAPRGWAFCDGQILPINQNQSLYSLLGTTFGGDGRTSFALPDLRGRVSVHPGQGAGLPNYVLGQKGGENNVTLNVNEIPSHSHTLNVNSAEGNTHDPNGKFLASNSEGVKHYSDESSSHTAHDNSIQNSAGNQGHTNMQPYLGINHCIAITGLFPSRN